MSYIDAFVVTWSLCPAGLTFQFVTEIPVLGRAIRALQVGLVHSTCAQLQPPAASARAPNPNCVSLPLFSALATSFCDPTAAKTLALLPHKHTLVVSLTNIHWHSHSQTHTDTLVLSQILRTCTCSRGSAWWTWSKRGAS